MRNKIIRRAPPKTQAGVRLSPELHERLLKAADNRSLGDEIRRRLEASFGPDAGADPKTRQFLDMAADFAGHAALAGLWHEDPYAFQLFKAGVLRLLSYFQPPGDPAGKSRVPFDTKDIPPAAIGEMLVSQTFSTVFDGDAWPELPPGVAPGPGNDAWLREQPARGTKKEA